MKKARWVSEGGSWLFHWAVATLAFWLVGKVTGDEPGWMTCAVFALFALASGELSRRWHRYRRSKKQARVLSAPSNEQ
ncbi:hypothetical protein [Streptomyces sp. NPDC002088]|uniref:hypothetical protein n=1 Tax=Streptomyces sp. NPDC002088 TaxID=3154665 RepID=UPI00331BD24D